jgi:hypothetical protein
VRIGKRISEDALHLGAGQSHSRSSQNGGGGARQAQMEHDVHIGMAAPHDIGNAYEDQQRDGAGHINYLSARIHGTNLTINTVLEPFCMSYGVNFNDYN